MLQISTGIVPEMETADEPDVECDLLESRFAASAQGATIHCADNAERSYIKEPQSESDESSDICSHSMNAISQLEATQM